MRVYQALLTDAPAPACLLKWDMMERFKWTEEIYLHLSVSSLHEYLQIQDGRYKANNSLLRKNNGPKNR